MCWERDGGRVQLLWLQLQPLGVKWGTQQPVHVRVCVPSKSQTVSTTPPPPTFYPHSPALLSTALRPALRGHAPQPLVRSQPSAQQLCGLPQTAHLLWSSFALLSRGMCRVTPRATRRVTAKGDGVSKTRLLSEGTRWEWGLAGLAVRAGPGSSPPSTQLRAWHAVDAGIVL